MMNQHLPAINHNLKQAQIKDTKNTLTSKEIKSKTCKYLEQPWGFSLANKKRDQLQRIRKLQIEREDKALTTRMGAINERSRYRSHIQVEKIYLKNSLHGGFQKELNKVIADQNHSNKKRLESLKPTINLKKLQKDWQVRESIKKNLQKYYSKDNNNRSMSIQLDKLYRITINERDIVKYYKQRCIDGHNILIKIEQYDHLVLITGEIRSKDQIVYISIEKDKIQHILEEQNKNRIQILGNLLKFDPQTSSLYLIPKNLDSSEKKEYFISSKIDDFNLKSLRNAIRKQHIQFLSNKQALKKEVQKEYQIESTKTEKKQHKTTNNTSS